MSPDIEKQIIEVLDYFAYFKYAPSFDEIYVFLPVKTTKKQLTSVLNNMIGKKLLLHQNIQTTNYYTLQGHGIYFNERIARTKKTAIKLKKVNRYIAIIAKLPQVKLIGLSGSCAMGHASKSDDVDLFIIASRGQIWTARFFAILVATMLGMRRKRGEKKAADKICLNMFFDERDMTIPYKKQNLYTAHEVAQMKPLVNKNRGYEKFLKANRWVYEYFPHAKKSRSIPRFKQPSGTPGQAGIPRSFETGIFASIESVLKKLQLSIINQHKTNEIITDTQLWFFPHDFEDRLRRKKILTD